MIALAQLGLSLPVQLDERKTCTSCKRSDRPFRERERDIQTDRQADRQTQTEKETGRQRVIQ